MQSPYLTIAEAVEKIGRSPSTIRRLIRQIADSPSHPDRPGIEPAPKQVDVHKKKGENFTWKIAQDVLDKHLKGVLDREKKRSNASRVDASQDVVHILKSELDIKNQQIKDLGGVITSLNERLREGNILMGSLQQRLALPQAEASTPPVEASAVKPSAEPHHNPSKKGHAENFSPASKKASVKAPRKGILRWLLR